MSVFESGRARALACLALGGLVSVAACGGDETPSNDDRDADGSGADAGTDAGGDGGTGTDTSVPQPNAESVFYLFTREATVSSPSLPDYTQLMVATDGCTSEASDLCSAGESSCEIYEIEPLNGTEPFCDNGCRATDDLSWLVFNDPTESRTLRKIALAVNGDTISVSGDSTIIATEVNQWDVGGHVVAFATGGAATAHNLDTGAEASAGDVGNSDRFAVSPDGEWVYIKRVTSLTAMDLVRAPVAGGEVEIVHSFLDGGPPNAAGSLLRGTEPVAFSPDGSRIAVLTNYRHQSNFCTDPSECLEPGFTCPTGDTRGRCYAQQLAMQVINLDAFASLGEDCVSDAECGADHFCDLSAPDNNGNGTCLPGRFVLGASGQDRCSILTLGQYDDNGEGLAWRSDREIMALLSNSCNGTPGTLVTDLAVLDIDSGITSPMVENPGLPFDASACIDQDGNCYEPALCTVEFARFAASPSGETIALIGDSYRSQNTTELWSYDTAGVSEKNIMTTSIDYDVITVSVHAR